MVKTLLRNNWRSTEIDRLFVDGIDWNGLEYIYEDIGEVVKELTEPKKKK